MSPTPNTTSESENSREPSLGKSEKDLVDPTQTPATVIPESKEEAVEPGHAPQVRTVHGWKWALTFVSLAIAAMIYGLDGTIAADIQSAIIVEYGEVEKLTWIGTAFPLGSLTAVLPVATMYTMFNLKPMFIVSIIIFEAASALCGAAPTMNALIVGRALAGVGGTGIYLGILNYLTLCTADQERGRYISSVGIFWGLGSVLGPVVGGAFSTSSATWRWAFYINLVVAAICAPVYIFYLPFVTPHGATDSSVLTRFKRLDWLGSILGMGCATAFTLVLTFAGAGWRWNDGRTIATFVVAGALLIGVVVQQRFLILTTLTTRMFPPRHILLHKEQALLCINTAMAATNIYVPVYYIPLYFALTQGDSELMAAVRLLPYICFLAVMNFVSGALLPKINYYWTVYLIGGIFMLIGGATLYTIDSETPMANVYGYSILIGTGTGLVFNLGFAVSGLAIFLETGNPLNIQYVISLQNLSQLGFQTLSLLVGGQMFQSLSVRNLTQVLGPLGFSSGDIRLAVAGTKSPFYDTLAPEVQELVVNSIISALSKVYALSIATGAITIIVALLMKKEKLFKPPPPAVEA